MDLTERELIVAALLVMAGHGDRGMTVPEGDMAARLAAADESQRLIESLQTDADMVAERCLADMAAVIRNAANGSP